jgi:hypothetical protein
MSERLFAYYVRPIADKYRGVGLFVVTDVESLFKVIDAQNISPWTTWFKLVAEGNGALKISSEKLKRPKGYQGFMKFALGEEKQIVAVKVC